jgi:hypothetical protein
MGLGKEYVFLKAMHKKKQSLGVNLSDTKIPWSFHICSQAVMGYPP